MDLKYRMFDVDIDCLTMTETVERIASEIENNRQTVHNSVNANKVVLMAKDQLLKRSLQSADILNADGQSVVWVSRFLGKKLPERVTGIDLMDNLIRMADERGHKIFLLGAKEEVVKKVVEVYSQLYSKELIGGYHNGYFGLKEESEVIKQINDSEAALLFVAIPSPQKENFIKRYRAQMYNIKLLMGVGGSFDVVSGKIKRAPRWMQNNGFEWLFRLFMEPRKMWRRYLIGNIEFLKIAIDEYRNRSPQD